MMWGSQDPFGHSHFLFQVNAAIKRCAMTLGMDPYPQARGDPVVAKVKVCTPGKLPSQMESFRGSVKLGGG